MSHGSLDETSTTQPPLARPCVPAEVLFCVLSAHPLFSPLTYHTHTHTQPRKFCAPAPLSRVPLGQSNVIGSPSAVSPASPLLGGAAPPCTPCLGVDSVSSGASPRGVLKALQNVDPSRPLGGRSNNGFRTGSPPQQQQRHGGSSPSAAPLARHDTASPPPMPKGCPQTPPPRPAQQVVPVADPPLEGGGGGGGVDDEDGSPRQRETRKKNMLESRLTRNIEASTNSPATASIIAASQGLAEEALMVVAELVTFIARRQGGRAGRQRRGAVQEAPHTVDHIAEWLAQQTELLGHDCMPGGGAPPTESDAASMLTVERMRQRRSSSCPAAGRKPRRSLAKGQRVRANKEIKSSKVVVVAAGTEGTVNHVIHGGKVNVTFDHRMDSSSKPINVKVDCVEELVEDCDDFGYRHSGFGDDN